MKKRILEREEDEKVLRQMKNMHDIYEKGQLLYLQKCSHVHMSEFCFLTFSLWFFIAFVEFTRICMCAFFKCIVMEISQSHLPDNFRWSAFF